METKFNFKSAVCTSIEQSRKLLSLGLKKETADCHWYDGAYFDDDDDWQPYIGCPKLEVEIDGGMIKIKNVC